MEFELELFDGATKTTGCEFCAGACAGAGAVEGAADWVAVSLEAGEVFADGVDEADGDEEGDGDATGVFDPSELTGPDAPLTGAGEDSADGEEDGAGEDRKSTRLNSSHTVI